MSESVLIRRTASSHASNWHWCRRRRNGHPPADAAYRSGKRAYRNPRLPPHLRRQRRIRGLPGRHEDVRRHGTRPGHARRPVRARRPQLARQVVPPGRYGRVPGLRLRKPRLLGRLLPGAGQTQQELLALRTLCRSASTTCSATSSRWWRRSIAGETRNSPTLRPVSSSIRPSSKASSRCRGTWRGRCTSCTSTRNTRNSQPRTMWSLSNAFTSAFKELDPIPQYKATGEARRLS